MAEVIDPSDLAARLRRLADDLVDVGQDMVRIGDHGDHGGFAETGNYLSGYVSQCVLSWADVIDRPMRLEAWSIFDDRVRGEVFCNPKFNDGEMVITSPIQSIDGNRLKTLNSTYVLGARLVGNAESES
jgi:hypothetical protein